MEMNRKLEKYQEILELQKKLQKGIISKEQLTCKEKMILCRLYDLQIFETEKENKKLLNKVLEYRKRIS